jgi:hypothetical protein
MDFVTISAEGFEVGLETGIVCWSESENSGTNNKNIIKLILVLLNGITSSFQDAEPNTFLHRIYSEIMMKDPKGLPLTDTDGFQRICEEDYAYMTSTLYVRSVTEPAKCALVRVPTQYFQTHLAIVPSNDSEYRNTINHQ